MIRYSFDTVLYQFLETGIHQLDVFYVLFKTWGFILYPLSVFPYSLFKRVWKDYIWYKDFQLIFFFAWKMAIRLFDKTRLNAMIFYNQNTHFAYIYTIWQVVLPVQAHQHIYKRQVRKFDVILKIETQNIILP